MSDTDTLTAPTTADVLAGMFTENTGRALCDSGDAYGRNWERNQGRDAQSFLDAPAAVFDKYSGPVLNTFHFLNDRLEFAPELQAEFDAYAEERPDDGWFSLMEQWVEDHDEWVSITVNTYNHENALDQTIQYIQIDTDGGDACYGDVVILQVHGGCDVRGGYTAPKVFTTCGEVGLLDDADVDIWCSGSTVVAPQTETLPAFDDTPPVEIQHSWYSDDAGYHWYGNECDDYSGLSYGSDDPEVEFDDDGNAICPIPECTGTLHASGRYC